MPEFQEFAGAFMQDFMKGLMVMNAGQAASGGIYGGLAGADPAGSAMGIDGGLAGAVGGAQPSEEDILASMPQGFGGEEELPMPPGMEAPLGDDIPGLPPIESQLDFGGGPMPLPGPGGPPGMTAPLGPEEQAILAALQKQGGPGIPR
jgi:hypothetical protein